MRRLSGPTTSTLPPHERGTMPNLNGWELPILLILAILLFGAKRLPDLARGLGRSLRIFKAEVKAKDDAEDTKESDNKQ